MDLLGIYLDDHPAGAAAATERACRRARTTGDRVLGDALGPVGAETARDRAAFGIMRLGAPVPGWRTLRCLAPAEGRLDVHRLGSLIERAERQRDVLEEWRVRRAGTALRGG